jgi:tetratricopeptide (TPR) repeat protein
LFPGEGWIPAERGAVHLRAGQREEAIRAFTDAVKAASLDPSTSRSVGMQVWDLFGIHRDFEGGHAFVASWLKAHAEDPHAWWWRGYLHELAAEAGDAEAAYRKSWELSGRKHGEAALHLGLYAARRGDEKAATPLLEASLRLGARPRPETLPAVEALIGIAGTHMEKGRLPRAIELLKGALPFAADHPLLRQNIGFFLRELGSQEAAKRNLSRAKALWKESAEHYVIAAEQILQSEHTPNRKAQVLNDTGLMFHYHLESLDRGIAYYERALEHDPEYLDALENMGVAMGQKGRWQDALGWFDRVLALAPGRGVSVAGKKVAEEALAKDARKKG